MSKPIKATPILRGEDARKLEADVERVNKYIAEANKNPVFKKAYLKERNRLIKLYKDFQKRKKKKERKCLTG